MKYQALKRLKTKNKLIKLCDTLREAHDTIRGDGGTFVEFSYIGGFPTYKNKKGQYYSIQGLHEGYNIVLGLDQKELTEFSFV